jgi:hypothetical protein
VSRTAPAPTTEGNAGLLDVQAAVGAAARLAPPTEVVPENRSSSQGGRSGRHDPRDPDPGSRRGSGSRRCASAPTSTRCARRVELLVLERHDEFRDPASVVEATDDWSATELDVIRRGRFFVGH